MRELVLLLQWTSEYYCTKCYQNIKTFNSLTVILLQCLKVWKTSPVTGHHLPALWRINNWQTIWMSSIAGLKNHHSHLSHTCTVCQVFQKKESTRPWRCVISLFEYLCWPVGPHLHTDLQQITGAVWSPLVLKTLHLWLWRLWPLNHLKD